MLKRQRHVAQVTSGFNQNQRPHVNGNGWWAFARHMDGFGLGSNRCLHGSHFVRVRVNPLQTRTLCHIHQSIGWQRIGRYLGHAGTRCRCSWNGLHGNWRGQRCSGSRHFSLTGCRRLLWRRVRNGFTFGGLRSNGLGGNTQVWPLFALASGSTLTTIAVAAAFFTGFTVCIAGRTRRAIGVHR